LTSLFITVRYNYFPSLTVGFRDSLVNLADKGVEMASEVLLTHFVHFKTYPVF